jgi:hypothetical protein
MKTLKLVAVVAGLLSMGQAANSATITNGNFSAGLSGWTTQGSVGVSNGYAVLTSTGASTGSYGGTNGAILSQAINASAGDRISFSYDFVGGDYNPYNDFSLVVGDSTHLLSNIAAVGNYGTTGWRNYSFIAATHFTNLKFIVSNALDQNLNSKLYIDNVNVRVAETPIPAAVWLFGSGVAGLMGARRKKMLAAPLAA